jgi:transposase
MLLTLAIYFKQDENRGENMARKRTRKYQVRLTQAQVVTIERMLKERSVSNTIIDRGRLLLLLDENHGERYSHEQVADSAGVSLATVANVSKIFAEDGLEGVLTFKRHENSDNAKRKMDGRAEAKIIQIACGPVPEGHSRWTLRLLEEKAKIELNVPVSKNTIARTLKKNWIRPHRYSYWCIPSKENAEFAARMEDVLDVYELPYNPQKPVVCMDEKPYQLLGDARPVLPVRPGSDRKIDAEYVRHGTCSICAFVEPLGGKHHCEAKNQRTAIDWAHQIKFLVDTIYPKAEVIILVMDNLNTHSPSSLYKAFPPEEARRILRKLELHYTPKHGSWLNMAEIELNVMTRQCLSRRLDSLEEVSQ